jgi:adenylyltransferase/sulfurtransferase
LPEEGSYDTCDTVGVISPITNIVASYEAAETMKLLLDSESVCRQAISMDAWDSYTEFFDVDKDPECPVCGKHQYTRLEHRQKNYTASLCGHDAYQITPEDDGLFDYEAAVESLQGRGTLEKKKYFTVFRNDEADFKLFPDGRAIINGAADSTSAQRIYIRYIGS